VAYSGSKTGRSPNDKRIVKRQPSEDEIWWGPVNFPLDELSFKINRQRAIDYLASRDRIYVMDGYAGWDPEHRLKIRVICSRPYHALFIKTMLIRPDPDNLVSFGEPDYVIFNAGAFPANPLTAGMTSRTSVDLSFEAREMVILGTEYAGEMKKGGVHHHELSDAETRFAADALLHNDVQDEHRALATLRFIGHR
jgi:phosphoenolpyruvate carboxykinase (ATP)